MWGAFAVGAWMSSGALAGPFDKAPEPPELPDEVPDEVEDVLEGDKEARESEVEAARKRYDAEQAQLAARVVVVQWPGTRADHTNLDLQRNVRNRIARPSAKFYPEIDLFQAGRTAPDPTLRPTEHLSAVLAPHTGDEIGYAAFGIARHERTGRYDPSQLLGVQTLNERFVEADPTDGDAL